MLSKEGHVGVETKSTFLHSTVQGQRVTASSPFVLHFTHGSASEKVMKLSLSNDIYAAGVYCLVDDTKLSNVLGDQGFSL